jgi:hypothetical protein
MGWAVGLILLAWRPCAAEDVGLRDDFSGYAAESDGAPRWVVQDGQWRVQGGAYEQSDPTREGVVTFSAGPDFGDLRFSVRFRIEPVGAGVRAAGMVFRSVDSQSYCYVHFDSRFSQVILVKHTRARPWMELFRTRGIPIKPGEWHVGLVECDGSHFRVSLDGGLVGEGDDKEFPVGRIGLRAGQGRIQFDDVLVEGRPQKPQKEWTLMKPVTEVSVPRLESAERIVAVQGGGYFPVLIRLKDGRLGAVVRGGAGHLGIQGRLDWISSADGGKTWSAPTVIVDSEFDDRNPSLGQAADGTIIVGYAEASTYNAQGQFDMKSGKYELFTVASRDGGKTWATKRPMNIREYPQGSVFGRAIVLPDATLLMPVYWSGCGVLRSRDNGETWGDPSRLAPDQDEFSLVRLPSGRLVAMARSNGLTGYHCDDAGRTWKQTAKVTKPNQHPADLCLLKSGTILLVYGSRIEPYGVGAMLSRDGGQTWDHKHRVMLAWDSQNADTGYPSAVQLDDGTIVVLYYAVGTYGLLPGKEQAVCIRFTEKQLDETGARAKGE